MARTLTPAELLDALALEGYGRDPALRMRAEYVAATLGAGRSVEDLCTLLAPLLATSPDEQGRFYEDFRRIVKQGVPAAGPGPGPGPSDGGAAPPADAADDVKPPSPGWPLFLGAMLLTLGLAAAGTRMHPGPLSRFLGGQGADTAAVVATPGGGDSLGGTGPAGPARPVPAADSGAVATRPHGDGDARAARGEVLAPEPRVREPRGGGHLWMLIRLFATLLPFALLAAHQLWRLLFLRPAVMRGPEARSPFALRPPRLPRPTFPYDPEELRLAARTARRQRSETVALSLRETVAATVDAGGFPTFRYRAHTRPSEYLFLIERASPRDQQAWSFVELAERLKAEGVLVHRYFFDADPRTCYPEQGGRGVGLAELFREHPGHRLFICGDGRTLTDAVTGRLHPWTVALAQWADRALLTPEPVGRWEMHEGFVAEALPVFPATLHGVREAVEFFRMEADQDWYTWWEKHLSPPEPGPPPPTASPDTLRAYLGERGYAWLAACAVYPELHWRLTLRLGTLAEPPGAAGGPVERDLLRLARLPWMRRGSIPNPDRAALLDGMSNEHEASVRALILRMLDEAAGEHARGRTLRMDFDRALQRLFLHRDEPRRRRALLRQARALPRRPLVQDVAVVRLLNRLVPPRLGLLLPPRHRHLLYHDGIAALGIRFLPLLLGAASLAALVHFAPLWPRPQIPVPIVSLQLPVAGSLTLPPRASGLGLDGDGRLRWVSADTGIQVVDDEIRGRAWGQSLVVIHMGRGRAEVPVFVGGEARVPIVRIAERWLTDSIGRLRPVLAPPGTMRWASCTPWVAAVDASGLIRARSAGTAVVVGQGSHLEFGLVRVSSLAPPETGAAVAALAEPVHVVDRLPPGAIQALDRKRQILQADPSLRVSVTEFSRAERTTLLFDVARAVGYDLSVAGGQVSVGESVPACAHVAEYLAREGLEREGVSHGVFGFEVTRAPRGGSPVPVPPVTIDTTQAPSERAGTQGPGAIADTDSSDGNADRYPPVPQPQPSPDPPARRIVEQGHAAFRAGNLARAQEVYAGLATVATDSTRLQGIVLSRQARWQEAESVLGRLMFASMTDPDLLNEYCSIPRGNPTEMSESYCSRPPADSLLRQALRTMLFSLGQDPVVRTSPGRPVQDTIRYTRFDVLSRFEPEANGLRFWQQSGVDEWTETAHDGTAWTYRVMGRARVYDDEGTIYRRKSAGPVFEVFVPDMATGPSRPAVRYRTDPGSDEWRYLGPVVRRGASGARSD